MLDHSKITTCLWFDKRVKEAAEARKAPLEAELVIAATEPSPAQRQAV